MSGRIRTIKPEIIEDERSAGLSSDAWRLWVCMWLLADDHGNLRGDSRRLAADVFWAAPEPVNVADLLEELSAAGLITRYAVRGQQYVSINNWNKHQRVDNAGKPRVPSPTEADQNGAPTETRGESPRNSEIRGSDPDPDQRPPNTTTARARVWSDAVFTETWSRITCKSGQARVELLTEAAAKCADSARVRGVDVETHAAALIAALPRVITWLKKQGLSTPALSISTFVEDKHFSRCEDVVAGRLNPDEEIPDRPTSRSSKPAEPPRRQYQSAEDYAAAQRRASEGGE